jgi:hypothetical protein
MDYGEGNVYQSRYLSNEGRVFFDSSDALVPADVNGVSDVYEFEPVGVGNCSEATRTNSFEYVPSAGGCVGLISSGTSSEESAFLDASENGNDVFFLTAAKLAPQDYDTSDDVYDAHECTTESPCIPNPAGPSPECTTVDACRAAPTPEPSIYGPPSSATFNGQGNVTSETPAKKKVTKKAAKCPRGKVRNKRHRCVKRAKQANRKRRK